MTTVEADVTLAEQLSGLDWGDKASDPDHGRDYAKIEQQERDAIHSPPGGAELSADLVAVPGVPVRVRKDRRRAARAPRIVPEEQRRRRARSSPADILVAGGESPAVLSLFEKMWRDQGVGLARSIGRDKVSKQDAAIGWYMLLLTMRARGEK